MEVRSGCAEPGAASDLGCGFDRAVFHRGLEGGVVAFVLVGVGLSEVRDPLVGLGGAAKTGRSRCPGSWLARAPFRAVGLLEEVPHDLSMPGRDSGPQCARDAVLQLYEGDEEQFARQPQATVGAKECDVRGAAPDLPAEHKSVRLS